MLFAIFAGVLIGIVTLGFLAYLKVKNSIGSEVGMLLNVVGSTKTIEDQYNSTPKSVSHGESMYVRQILTKVPSFDNEELVDKIRVFVRELYSGTLDKSKYLLSEELAAFTQQDMTLSSDITVHDVGLSKYLPSGKFIKLVYQVAFTDGTQQYKIDVELLLTFESDMSHMRCPECNGPIESHHEKCPYCGTLIDTKSSKVWVFSSVHNNKKVG